MEPTTVIDHKAERRVLVPTIIFVLCGFLGVDIHLASLPAIMQFMHTDKAHMQQSISVYLLGMGISILFYGPLSDKYGRKPIVLFGLLLASLASFASCFTHTINLFLLTRLFQGLGCGVCAGLGRVVIADVLHGERFATKGSQFTMAIALSPMVAPLLGGYVQHSFGWQTNFAVLGGFILLSAIVYAFISPETNLNKNPDIFKLEKIMAHYGEFLTHRVFLLSTLTCGVAVAISMVYAALSPFILQTEFHLTPIIYGWVTGILGVSGLLGRFVIAQMVKKYGREKHMLICSNIFLVMVVILVLLNTLSIMSVLILSIIMFFCIFAQTALAPIVTSYAMEQFPTKKGMASSLFGSGQMLISFAITGIAGLFLAEGIVVLACTYVIMAVIIFLGARALNKQLTKN